MRQVKPVKHRRKTLLAGLGILLLTTVTAFGAFSAYAGKFENPYYKAVQGQADKAHHTPTGFQNRYGGNEEKGLLEVLQWQLSRNEPPEPAQPLPEAQPNLAVPLPNVTWIGHSTVLGQVAAVQTLDSGAWQTKTLRFITDPHFSERAAPTQWMGPKRLYAPALKPEQLPPLDVVLISHNHYDHLDVQSVQALQAQPSGTPLFIVPLGLKAWFAGIGIDNVVELDWWQSHRVMGVEFTLTPAQHWSSRTPFDRRQTLWGGFAVYAPSVDGGQAQHWIYTGDTGYSPDFLDIAKRMKKQGKPGFNFAMIPIGCYEPRDFMQEQHINPHEAVQIFQDLGAAKAIGVHWGTFAGLCDEPLDQAPRDLAAALTKHSLAPTAFQALARGQTLTIQ